MSELLSSPDFGTDGGGLQIVKPSLLAHGRTPAGPSPERIVSGKPVADAVNFYEGQGGQVQAGHWRCTPGRWRVSYDETEYCRIIEGSGALFDTAGRRTAIATGDEFVVPAGFVGEWEVVEAMTKTYVVVLP